MNVIILAKFSTNLQKLWSGYRINAKMKYSFFFGACCWQFFFLAKNFYNLIDYALERNRYVIMCVWHASMPQSNIQYTTEKNLVFSLCGWNLRNKIHFNVIRLSIFFSKLQTAFFSLKPEIRDVLYQYAHNIRCWPWEVKETKESPTMMRKTYA